MSDREECAAFLRKQLDEQIAAASGHELIDCTPVSEPPGSGPFLSVRGDMWSIPARVTVAAARDFAEAAERQRGDVMRSFGVPVAQVAENLTALGEQMAGRALLNIDPAIPEAEAARFRAAFQERLADSGRAPVVLSSPAAILPLKPLHQTAQRGHSQPVTRVNWPLVAEIETDIWGEPFDHYRGYERPRVTRRIPAAARVAEVLSLLGAVLALAWIIAVTH
jgi:hypothetical protein